ncbi:MAG: sensor histidine kinase, partial [Bryobacteraceae bacterium]
REPLRTVSTYCQLLSEKNAPGEEDEETKLFLGYILDGVDRAQALLTSMVEYATGSVSRRPPVAVDMNAVFAEAERAVDSVGKPEGAAICHDPLPIVTGDFDVLTKVMRHLIDNAIKFNRAPDPRVCVSATRDGAFWKFSVCDNGPGIDPAHHERIFGLFKRLHGRDYPGSGLGLAFCRKVVESLGGRVWVESRSPAQPEDSTSAQPEDSTSAQPEGSAFYFTLPVAED